MADVLVNRGERFVFDGNEPAPDTFVLEEPLDPSDLNKAVLQLVLEGTPLVKAERVNTGNLAALRLVGGDGLVVTMPLRINGDAIQTAIDAIPVSTGGKVVLPAGTYNLTRGLVANNIVNEGKGNAIYLLEDQNGSGERVISTPVVISANLPGNDNPSRGRKHVVALMPVATPTGQLAGATGMVFVNDNDPAKLHDSAARPIVFISGRRCRWFGEDQRDV
jgi:hypothetical protein